MRLAVVVGIVLLAGCGARAASGPAWPRSAGRVEVEDWKEDGGESIEPGVRSAHVAAIERAGEAKADEPVAEGDPLAPEGDKPAGDKAKPADAPKGETGATIEIQIEEIEVKPDEIIIVN